MIISKGDAAHKMGEVYKERKVTLIVIVAILFECCKETSSSWGWKMTPSSHNEDIRPNLAALRRRREPTNQSEERTAATLANKKTGNILGKITSARSET